MSIWREMLNSMRNMMLACPLLAAFSLVACGRSDLLPTLVASAGPQRDCVGVDTQTDAKNCGVCGNVCSAIAPSTAQCTLGRCLVTLDSESSYRAFAVGETDVYWVDGAGIMKLSLGGGVRTTLVSWGSYASAIAVSTTSVYWANAYGPVMRVPIGGGSPKILATSEKNDVATAIAVDSASVYWTTYWPMNSDPVVNGSVMKVSIDGGTPTTLASGPFRPEQVTVAAANVYWTASDATTGKSVVMKVAIDGGAPTIMPSANGCMAADVDSLYYCTSAGDIMKTPVGGGAAMTLASSQNVSGNISVDSTSVYWIDSHLDTSKVMKVPIEGGTPTMLASMDGAASKIAVDSTSVYWPIQGLGSLSRLMKLTPK